MAHTATAPQAKKPKSGSIATPVLATDPDHAMWWAAGVCALVTLVLAYPAFGGGFLVSPTSDQLIGGYAVRTFGTHWWLKTGHIPQWNPYLFGGLPYLAASQNGDVFYPTALLRVFLPGDVAVTWAFIIHEFLAGWFTYLFLRAFGLSFYGALGGALAYMLGGPIASYVSPGHDGKLYVSALFPLTAMVALYAVRGGRAWAYPTLAFLVGLGILTPHPQVMQYSLLAVGAIALYGAFWEKDPDERVDRRVAWQRIGLVVGAVLLGLLIGGIYYAPILSYIQYSPRAHGAMPGYASPYAFSVSYAMPPEEIINTYLPEFTGLFDNYFGRNHIHFHSEFIGAAVYALAGAGFFSALKSPRRRAAWFWMILIIVGFLWSLGGYTPFYHLVYWLVPGTKYFRAPSAFFFISAFGIAVLAGEGIDALMARRVTALYATVAAGVAAFVAVLAVSGALTTLGGTIAPAELYDMVVANAAQVTFGAVRALIAVLLVSAMILLVVRQRIDPVIAACAVMAVVAVELWSVERLYWKWSPPASVVYAPDSALKVVQHEPQPGRLLALQLAEGGVAQGDLELQYDLPMINGVRQVLGYHGNEIRRYDELLDHDGGYRQVLSPQIWRLLNIRFLLTNIDSLPVPGSAKIVGPEKDAAGSTLFLYRLPGDNPAAWVTPVAVKAPDDQTLATVRDPRFDPLRAAIFDTAAKVPTVGGLRALPEPLPVSVRTTRYDPGHMTYALSAPAPANATLIASENWYPGWTATVDGKPTTTGRADYTLIGVPLTAGATSVDLQFHDPALPLGERVTFAALLVSTIWLVLTLVRRRPEEAGEAAA